jgi:hypothetical protein
MKQVTETTDLITLLSSSLPPFSHFYSMALDWLYDMSALFMKEKKKSIIWRVFLQFHVFSSHVKGQLISKCLFGVFNFLQKTNENKSQSSKIEFVRSFFGGNLGLKKSFWFCLTFTKKPQFFITFLYDEIIILGRKEKRNEAREIQHVIWKHT